MSDSKLDSFQLKEYENISQAHFKTNEMIVAFYRYYLLVMALPVTFLGAGFASANEADKISLLSNWNVPASIFLLVIAILGVLMMCYMTGLKLESLLYARTVNGVRAYFFTDAPNDAVRVLPIDVTRPKLKLAGSHSFIVLSFATFNTLYLIAAILIMCVEITGAYPSHVVSTPRCLFYFLPFLTALSVALHLWVTILLGNQHNKKWT